MKKFSIALIVSFMCVAFVSFGQKPVDLAFNLPTGSGFDYNINMDVTTKGNVNGQDINVKNAMIVEYHFAVNGDSSGWKKMTSTISKIALTVNTQGVNINYDSDKPLDTSDVMNSTVGKVLGTMKGAQFQFTMNKNGDIGSVTGIDEMVNKMTQADATGGITGGLGNAFSEENFKQNLKQAFGVYPGKPVKVGDTWTSTTNTTSSGATLQMDNTYTLESVSGNIANVKVNSKITAPSTTAITAVTGTSAGTMQFDIPTGVPLNGDVNMNLNLTVNAGGQTMPMTTDIKMKITGKKS